MNGIGTEKLPDAARAITYEDAGLAFIRDAIKRHNPNMTKYEELFLDLYFKNIEAHHFAENRANRKSPASVYSAFLPIPEMQIYVADPLEDSLGYEPTDC